MKLSGNENREKELLKLKNIINFKNKGLEDKIETILTYILSTSKYKDINKRQHRLRVFEDQFQEIQ